MRNVKIMYCRVKVTSILVSIFEIAFTWEVL